MTEAEILKFAREILLPAGMINFAGIVLSLVCSYVPGWREKWAAREPTFKSIAMLVAITAITLVTAIVSFTGIIPVVPATTGGVIILIVSWFSSLVTNNTAYNYSIQVPSVTVIKEQQKVKLLTAAKVEVKEDKADQKILDKAEKDEQVIRDKAQKDIGH